MHRLGKTPVSWNFATIPSEEWKKGLSTAPPHHVRRRPGDANWDGVKSRFCGQLGRRVSAHTRVNFICAVKVKGGQEPARPLPRKNTCQFVRKATLIFQIPGLAGARWAFQIKESERPAEAPLRGYGGGHWLPAVTESTSTTGGGLMERAIKRWSPIFFLPTLLAFIIGFIVPFGQGIYLSFCRFHHRGQRPVGEV